MVCPLVGVVPSGGLWHGPKIWPKAFERQDVDLRSRPSRTSTPSVDLPVPVAQCSIFIYSSLSRYAVPGPHAGGGPGDDNNNNNSNNNNNNKRKT
jgi:hypothetical protein